MNPRPDAFAVAINNVRAELKNGITHVISVPGQDNARSIGPQVLRSLIRNNPGLQVDVITARENNSDYAAVVESIQTLSPPTIELLGLPDYRREAFAALEQREGTDIIFVDFSGNCDVFNVHLALTHYRKFGQTIVIISPEGIYQEAVTITPIESKTVVPLD